MGKGGGIRGREVEVQYTLTAPIFEVSEVRMGGGIHIYWGVLFTLEVSLGTDVNEAGKR